MSLHEILLLNPKPKVSAVLSSSLYFFLFKKMSFSLISQLIHAPMNGYGTRGLKHTKWQPCVHETVSLPVYEFGNCAFCVSVCVCA